MVVHPRHRPLCRLERRDDLYGIRHGRDVLMKAFFQTKRLILIVSLLPAPLFAAGGAYSNYMTDRITFHQFSDLFLTATEFHPFTPETIADEETFVGAYHAMNKQTMIGVVYVAFAQGKMGNLSIAYGVDIASDKVVGVKVVSQNETPEYYSRLSNAFFQQFGNYSFDRHSTCRSRRSPARRCPAPRSNSDWLRHGRSTLWTSISKSPSAVVLINSLAYNLDLATIVAKPILANITDLLTGETIDVSLLRHV
ncbi:MAG: FMN-binding protein [Bacillus subtilis]|nr:FMN-binding protein [Bacillus subtilis]